MPSRRDFLKKSGILAASARLAWTQPAPSRRPNVIVMLASGLPDLALDPTLHAPPSEAFRRGKRPVRTKLCLLSRDWSVTSILIYGPFPVRMRRPPRCNDRGLVRERAPKGFRDQSGNRLSQTKSAQSVLYAGGLASGGLDHCGRKRRPEHAAHRRPCGPIWIKDPGRTQAMRTGGTPNICSVSRLSRTHRP
jgi:hypothetical protein